MLSSARRLLATVAEQRALAKADAPAAAAQLRARAGLASVSCCGSTTATITTRLGATGSWRHMSSAADSTSSSSSSSSSQQQQPPAQQQQQPEASTSSAAASSPDGPMSEVVQQLTKASPTGRLLDLFTPSQQQIQTLQRSRGPGRGSRSGTGPAGPAAGTGVQAAEAAAPLTADSDVLEVLMRAVDNCKPLMKVIQSKAGTRVVYQPRPLNPDQSTNFAVKWILQAAQKRRAGAKGVAGAASMAEALAVELLLAAQRKGGARARRDEVHKLALDNRANLRR
ncbi:hypothetical protein CHLRE_14g618700v5 [Chlamydomonas reinhardtii]|uniref:Small ribosomal subunit protein uS7 domain-containing protein n=1 Tax=Chlamydomonas reinhardtii TaxID=3055 RepID=A0A2K3CXT8_CHLRE|nr:uncharacterized protein CHLRE_14g618700v5 [Chlamydomonas reinhardtii]PNW73097.1 hypothetical protein CHLRE_14g618700v5 [Chlamydomonas reinhardtii]